MKSGSSRPNEWRRHGAGAEDDSGAGSVRGAAAGGIYLLFSFRFVFVCFSVFGLSFSVSIHLSAGMKGSGGGAPPSSRLARRRRGYLGPVIL